MSRLSRVFSSAVFLGIGALALAALALDLSRTEVHFTTAASIALYYGLPAAVAALAFLALGLAPAARLLVAAHCVAVAAALAAFELYLAATPGQDRIWVLGGETKVELLKRIRAGGEAAYPTISPSQALAPGPDGTQRSVIEIGGREVLPLAGISGAKTVFCNEGQGWSIYDSDEHGFNNPGGLWGAAGLEVAAVGDSYVHGACVPPASAIMALVRKRYPRSLSLGYGGNGPLFMLAGIEEFLPDLRPDAVLWFYYEGNDLGNLHGERAAPLLMRYLDGGFRQGLRGMQAEIDGRLAGLAAQREAEVAQGMVASRTGPTRKLLGFATLSNLRTWLRGLGRPAPSSGDVTEDDFALLERILDRARTSAESWGGRLYFVFLPTWHRYYLDQDALEGFELGPRRERVLAIARGLGLPVIDVLPAFEAQEDAHALFYGPATHYSVAGYRLLADRVLAALAE